MGVLKIKFEDCNFGKVVGNGNFENWNFGELNFGIEVLKIKSKNYLRIEVLKIKFKNWNFEKLFENGNLGKLFLKSKKKNDTWLLWLHAKGGHAQNVFSYSFSFPHQTLKVGETCDIKKFGYNGEKKHSQTLTLIR